MEERNQDSSHILSDSSNKIFSNPKIGVKKSGFSAAISQLNKQSNNAKTDEQNKTSKPVEKQNPFAKNKTEEKKNEVSIFVENHNENNRDQAHTNQEVVEENKEQDRSDVVVESNNLSFCQQDAADPNPNCINDLDNQLINHNSVDDKTEVLANVSDNAHPQNDPIIIPENEPVIDNQEHKIIPKSKTDYCIEVKSRVSNFIDQACEMSFYENNQIINSDTYIDNGVKDSLNVQKEVESCIESLDQNIELINNANKNLKNVSNTLNNLSKLIKDYEECIFDRNPQVIDIQEFKMKTKITDLQCELEKTNILLQHKITNRNEIQSIIF